MSAGAIWWGRIGNSLRFLSRVTDTLREGRSAILPVPDRFPWRARFYEQVDLRRESFSVDRRMVRVDWPGDTDPDSWVLENLCSKKTQAEYWPDKTVAEYLGSRGDLELCDFYVWVRGLHTKEDLIQWADFAARYESAAAALERRAVFLLEYDGPAHRSAALPSIPYEIGAFDTRVFCLELASELESASLRGYQVELAIQLGGGDPELCASLLAAGDGLPQEPVSAARNILEQERSSEGEPFAPRSEEELSSAVWRAAVVLLFPVLEGFRFDFITRHEKELSRYLPIHNSNGDVVTEPSDLELGSLFYVVNTASYAFSEQELETVSLCRNVRNLLAHNKPVPYGDVSAVLSMQG